MSPCVVFLSLYVCVYMHSLCLPDYTIPQCTEEGPSLIDLRILFTGSYSFLFKIAHLV